MNKQSQCINALRFPLAVAVVAIHATVISVQAEGMEVFNTIFHLVSDGVAKIAVPLFFAISAWLFFVKGWTWQGYAEKLRRRCRTLIVPYILWNTLYLILWYAAQELLPSLISGNYTAIRDYRPLDFLRCFWDILGGTFPINGALWFLRNLIIFNLLAPLFYYPLRHCGTLLMPLLTVLYALGIGSGWFISMESIYFYALGTWLASNRRPLFRPLRHAHLIWLLWALLLVATLWWQPLTQCAVLTGCLYATHLTYTMAGRTARALPSRLSACSFFLFAYHMLPNALIGKLLLKLPGMDSEAAFLVAYPTLIIATTALGIALYNIGIRLTPRMMGILCGGRAATATTTRTSSPSAH